MAEENPKKLKKELKEEKERVEEIRKARLEKEEAMRKEKESARKEKELRAGKPMHNDEFPWSILIWVAVGAVAGYLVSIWRGNMIPFTAGGAVLGLVLKILFFGRKK